MGAIAGDVARNVAWQGKREARRGKARLGKREARNRARRGVARHG